MNIFVIVTLAAISLWSPSVMGYSKGAPPEVCDDMIPKHHVDPQKSELPFLVEVSAPEVKAGEKLQVTISGEKAKKTFKGFLLQMRDGKDHAVGTFSIPESEKEHARTLDCHGSKNSAATHKNSDDKNTLTLDWIAPEKKGKVQLFATVAENGGEFWAHQPIALVKIL